MNRPPVPTILDALPADIREELTSLAEAGRGLFGRKATQQIVDGHLDLIQRLRREYAATHADLAAVLQAVGITARDGEALTTATLSSAISRAVAKSGRRPGKRRAPGRRPSGSALTSDPELRARQPAETERTSFPTPTPASASPPAAVPATEVELREGSRLPGGKGAASLRPRLEIRRAHHRAVLLTLLDRSMEE